MALERNNDLNHKLERYRQAADRFWQMAAKAPHEVARDVWARYASFYQEMAARREHHLAKRRLQQERPDAK